MSSMQASYSKTGDKGDKGDAMNDPFAHNRLRERPPSPLAIGRGGTEGDRDLVSLPVPQTGGQVPMRSIEGIISGTQAERCSPQGVSPLRSGDAREWTLRAKDSELCRQYEDGWMLGAMAILGRSYAKIETAR